MVTKKVKKLEDLVLGNGKILLKAIEKKASIILAKDMNAASTAADEMNSTRIDYAIVVNSNGSKLVENGDIIIIANYSSFEVVAIKDKEDNTYVILPEFNITAVAKPDNFEL